ncbi:hypothetical protein [Plantactinospora sp. WMMB782]|uniref:hypothetical protein n=1 Tax=Plantactinospora sp. WMMB782 TaxID=3404121 RepID=UPI003B942E5E
MTGDESQHHPALERRYRRLLGCYPWEHRRAYEEEMLGVLLADSRPGQRWPAPADAANLALTAIRTRLGHAGRAAVDRSWSEAAASVGLLTAVLLCYLHALPLVRQVAWAFGRTASTEIIWYPDPALWTRAGLWTLTVLAVLAGPRRLPPLLAWPAVLVEVVALPFRYVDEPVTVLRMLTQTLLGVLCAVALTVPAPRRAAVTVLGRTRLLVIGGGTVLLLAVGGTESYLSNPWEVDPTVQVPISLLGPAGVLVIAFAVWGVPAPVRRRMMALLAPLAAVLLTVRLGLSGWEYSNQHMGHPVYLQPAQWVLLALVPLATLILGFVAVRRREQTLRLVALGRDADRQR